MHILNKFSHTVSLPFSAGHRVQREELDAVLVLLEKILLLLPELLQQRWQKHALTRLFKRLLHPANNSKLRRDSMRYGLFVATKHVFIHFINNVSLITRLFVLWYQILGEQADANIHSMFACLVPGFPHQPIHSSPNTVLSKVQNYRIFFLGNYFLFTVRCGHSHRAASFNPTASWRKRSGRFISILFGLVDGIHGYPGMIYCLLSNNG